jgi:two-component system, chemotaxis family, response regulator Rcp1
MKDESSSVIVRPFHLLLVEDNPGDVRLVREALTGCRRTNIEHVESASQACDLLNRKEGFADAPRPDLILLDLNLPVLSGQVFLRARQRVPGWMSIPVVVFTSSMNDSDRQTCLFLGADDYMVKPREWSDWTLVLHTLVDTYSYRSW